MSKSALETLFGSRARLKILKLFFRNHGEIFTLKEISLRIQENPNLVKKEIADLLAANLINKTKKSSKHGE